MADQGIISVLIASCNSSGFVLRKDFFFCTALGEMPTLILYGCYNAGGALCTWPTVNSRQFPFTCCSMWKKKQAAKISARHILCMFFTVLVNTKHVTFYTGKHMRHGKALLSSYIFGLWNDKKRSLNGDRWREVSHMCGAEGARPQVASIATVIIKHTKKKALRG